MLLYALDELFYVYAQIKNSQRDDKVVLAYEILCISANRCTDRRNGIEKTELFQNNSIQLNFGVCETPKQRVV